LAFPGPCIEIVLRVDTRVAAMQIQKTGARERLPRDDDFYITKEFERIASLLPRRMNRQEGDESFDVIVTKHMLYGTKRSLGCTLRLQGQRAPMNKNAQQFDKYIHPINRTMSKISFIFKTNRVTM